MIIATISFEPSNFVSIHSLVQIESSEGVIDYNHPSK